MDINKMNQQELIEVISAPGRYEVISEKDGNFIAIPMSHSAILIEQESNEECLQFFRSKES